MGTQHSTARDTGLGHVHVDTDACVRAVTAITGAPAHVGRPSLTFFAVLVPVVSDGITFHVYPDGHLEGMFAPCPACGRQMRVRAYTESTYGTGPYPSYRQLAGQRREIRPRRGFARLMRRTFGCGACR